ncbi:GH32 C-terminal domain-containing protein [Natronomonas sp. EA1]|uniref:GH32 C-terminal domain-containing protein n=1 Tax=Natronomonas sp. EA1 TaxID=3421655 RepID=UPI003EB8A0C3
MNPHALRVAALTVGEWTPEQTAAYDWLAGEAASVEAVALDDLSPSDLAAYDVAWWHRDRPLDWEAFDPTAAAPALTGYLEDGGGLLLTLHGLSAVEPLGIDSVPPDAVGHESTPAPSGYLVKRVHADHPVFEGLDDAFHTRGADTDTAFARYESVVPARGDILAAGRVGDDSLVGHKPLVEWRVGTGRVLGAGTGLSFSNVRDYACAATRERFVLNCLGSLAGPRRRAFTDRPASGEGFRAVREKLATDHHRPGYHLAAPAGWLNDPNGLIEHEGTYHVFYQYNPAGPYHGAIHWGHATSEDLLSWDDQPVALAPDPEGPDRDGCWSGCAVHDDDGTPTILYTGGRHRRQLPCLATATDDDLSGWEKDPRNPIIDAAPSGLDVLETDDWEAEFRDHCVWKQDGRWYQIIGSGLHGTGGCALLYEGEALDDWRFVGVLHRATAPDAGAVWECPELLDLGDAQLLHVSNYDKVRYFLGDSDLDAPGFDVHESGLLDHGDFYAPQSLATSDGRHLMWGWLPEARALDAQWEAGWSGLLSVPRELTTEGGAFVQRPARELAALRDRHAETGDLALTAGSHRALDLAGNRYELAVELDREPGTTLELGLFESPAGSERTVLRWTEDALVVDRSRASHDDRTSTEEQRAPVAGDSLSVRVFVDRSTVEVFANEATCLTSRVYPTRVDADGVTLTADGRVEGTLDAWELRGTFPAGQTQ